MEVSQEDLKNLKQVMSASQKLELLNIYQRKKRIAEKKKARGITESVHHIHESECQCQCQGFNTFIENLEETDKVSFHQVFDRFAHLEGLNPNIAGQVTDLFTEFLKKAESLILDQAH